MSYTANRQTDRQTRVKTLPSPTCGGSNNRPEAQLLHRDSVTPHVSETLSTAAQLYEQEAQLSPTDPRDALYQLKCRTDVVRITQTDRVLAREAYSPTAKFHFAICMYTHRCIRLNYRTAIMLGYAEGVINMLSYDQPSWCQLLSSDFDYHQSCSWHHIFLRQRTVVGADDHGGRTQVFGGFEPGTSWSVEKRNFTYPTLHLAPRLGVKPSEFRRDLMCLVTGVPKLSYGVVCAILCLAVLVQYQLVTIGVK